MPHLRSRGTWFTLKISIALIVHSLDLRWSAGIWTYRILLTLGISIALIIHSLDLRWSELPVERTIPTGIMKCISNAKILLRGLLRERNYVGIEKAFLEFSQRPNLICPIPVRMP